MAKDMFVAKNLNSYLDNPSLLADHIKLCGTKWKSRFINPMGTAYEAGLKRANKIHSKADVQRRAHMKELARITAVSNAVLSVLLLGLEVFGKSLGKAIRPTGRSVEKVTKVKMLKKDVMHYLAREAGQQPAIVKYLAQKDSLSAIFLEQFDKKLGEKSIQIAAKKLMSKIEKKKDHLEKARLGKSPLAYQNNLDTGYKEIQIAIEEFYFTNLSQPYKRGDLSREGFKRNIEVFTSTPFFYPPDKPIGNIIQRPFSNWFAALIWLDVVINRKFTKKYFVKQESGKKEFFILGEQDRFTAIEINKVVHSGTGYYFTMTGMKKGKIPFQYHSVWDGWISVAHKEAAIKSKLPIYKTMASWFEVL